MSTSGKSSTPRKRSGVTLMDVARLAGVSHGAVSRTLRAQADDEIDIGIATQQKIREAADKLGYVVNARARLLREGKSNIVGVLVDAIEGSFRPAMIGHLSRLFQERGLEMLLAVHQGDSDDAKRHIDSFRSQRTRGIIVMTGQGNRLTDSALMAAQAGRSECGDCVSISFSTRHQGVRSVAIDIEGCFDELVAAAAVSPYPNLLFTGPNDASFAACTGALLAAATRHPNLQPHIHSFSSQNTDERVASTIKYLNHIDTPVILATPDDRMAFHLCRGLAREGLAVPERVAVVGYGNWEIATLCSPPLTTFDVQSTLAELAQSAVKMLCDDNHQTDALMLHRPQLVVRDSFVPTHGAGR